MVFWPPSLRPVCLCKPTRSAGRDISSGNLDFRFRRDGSCVLLFSTPTCFPYTTMQTIPLRLLLRASLSLFLSPQHSPGCRHILVILRSHALLFGLRLVSISNSTRL